MKKRVLCFFSVVLCLICLLDVSTIYASDIQTEKGDKEESKELNEVTEETEQNETEMLDLNSVYIDFSEEESIKNIDKLVKGFSKDFTSVLKEGLASLKSSIPTRDNVDLKQWGDFLYAYGGVDIISYPIIPVSVVVNETTYVFVPSKELNNWVKNTLLPLFKQDVLGLSKDYPVKLYSLTIPKNTLLTDYKLDLSTQKLKEVAVYYPFDEENFNFLVVDNGANKGLAVQLKYFETLKGYHKEIDGMLPIESTEPCAVSTIVYVVKPSKYVEDSKELCLSDMHMYKGLSVDLCENTNGSFSLLNGSLPVLYSEYSLDEKNLILVQLSDSLCVVQPKYLECYKWGKWDLNTGCIVDLSGVYLDGVENTVDSKPVDISMYISDDGTFNIEEGKTNTFLVYMRQDKLAMERIVNWLYSDNYSLRMSKENRDALIEDMSTAMKIRGRGLEMDGYLRANGVVVAKTKGFIVLGIIVAVSIFVIVLLCKKAQERKIKRKAGTLFDDDNNL